MLVNISKNGCVSLCEGSLSLENICPLIDGQKILPVQVDVKENDISFRLEHGSVSLRVSSSPESVEISCTAAGLKGVHTIAPIGAARLKGAGRVFLQGLGMEGRSRFENLEGSGWGRKVSHGLTACEGAGTALAVYAVDHTRFLSSAVYTCFSDPNAAAGFPKDRAEVLFQYGFNLEGCAGEEETLPSVFIRKGTDPEKLLKAAAWQIASFMHARNMQPPAFHWCSWYYYYQNMSQEILEDCAKDMAENRALQMRSIQLDAGYAPSPGDWLLTNHRYPEGLEKAAQTIRDAGFAPGIWIAPFMVGDRSALCREHPDWLLKYTDGTPVIRLKSYTEPKTWGNPDSNYYVLDLSHPEAFDYLRNVFRTLTAWGYRLFKTDFLFWNMVDSFDVKRFTPGKTSVEVLRSAMQMIREEIGEESYLLGCIAPFMPMIGYADGMRVGGDVGARWSDVFGPVNMLQELQYNQYFQHVFWQNDPDSVILRSFDTELTWRETVSLALIQALSGGVVTTSDPIRDLGEERKMLLRLIKPHGWHVPEFPYWTKEREDIVLVQRLEQGNLLYVMNPTQRRLTGLYSIKELFGDGDFHITRHTFGEEEPLRLAPGEYSRECLPLTLEPHEAALLYVTGEPMKKLPSNLWSW